MKSVILCLYFSITPILLGCAQPREYEKLMGVWEIVSAEKDFRGMALFEISYDEARKALYVIIGDYKTFACYDSAKGILRFDLRIGPGSDLEELRIAGSSLVHYAFWEGEWKRLKEYVRVREKK